jgi:hypothetical protein
VVNRTSSILPLMLKSKMTGVSPDADRRLVYLDLEGQMLMIDDWWWKLWGSWIFDEHGKSILLSVWM